MRLPHGPLLALLVLVAAAAACSSPRGGGNEKSDRPAVPEERDEAGDVAVDSEAKPAPGPSAEALAGHLVAGGSTGRVGLRPHDFAGVLAMIRAEDPAHPRLATIAAVRWSVAHWPESARTTTAGRFLLGKLLVQAGDPAAADAMRAVPAPLDPVEDLRLLYLSNALVLSGELDAALEAYQNLLRRDATSTGVHDLRVRLASGLREAGRYDDARPLLRANRAAGMKVARHLRAETMRGEVDLAMAEEGEATSTARELSRRLLVGHPGERATLRPGLPLEVDDLSQRDKFDRADRLQRDMHYEAAREGFRELMETKRYGYEATWRVAQISGRWYRDEPAKARELYREIGERGGEYKGKIDWRVLSTLKLEFKFEEAYAHVRENFPHSGDGLYFRAWFPYQLKDCETAAPLLKRYAFDQADSTVKGFWAWCAIREGQWEEAIDRFGTLIKYGNPIVRGKALYWQAYALEELGRREDAVAKLDRIHREYPLTWYDVLGYQMQARWEGRDPRASQLGIFECAGLARAREQAILHSDEPWRWPNMSDGTAARLDEVRWLVELDETERARAAYAPIRDSLERAVPSADRWAFILFMGHWTENHYHGWEKASGSVRAMSGEMPDPTDDQWLVAYPRAYSPLVGDIAGEFEIPEYLIYGIMLQESRFRWYQVSSWDALGALQMIPRTALSVAEDLGLEYERHRFMNPRVGFRYSAYYMSMHFRMWKSLSLTAASYNGGPHKVGFWMRRDEGKPLDMLVEEFSFDQSRHYCRKVTEHMLRYIYLYETDPVRRGELLDLLFPVEVDYGIPDDTGY